VKKGSNNLFNSTIDTVFYQRKELSVKGLMVLWRWLDFRQYIKDKGHKYGMKLYMLTKPNGMILHIFVYTG
jgi:predicted transcriptional regulator